MKNIIYLTLATISMVFNPGYASGTKVEDKIKDTIENVSDSLKKGVDKIGDDISAIQEYLDNYHWKETADHEAICDVATLSHLKLNEHKIALVVTPGEKIEGKVTCNLDPKKCSALSFYRVVIGIKGEGAQTTVCNYLGAVAKESIEKFHLVAPREPGMYQIRYRVVDRLLERDALHDWYDDSGNEPDAATTLGLLFVKA